MRPEILKLTAFGPYAGEQVIDFGRLGDRNLFLICGPTGAGKSSVLDALCYALYGEASGDERGELELRSQFAAPDRATRVELTFTKGDVRYRVERSPRQVRPKKRGGGLTEVGPKGALFRQAANGEWRTLASKPSQVSEQVQTVLGFQVSQFRQVVVLPQGQFRKLLSADSPQREQILATLFQTHQHRHFQEALKAKHRAVEKQIEALVQADRNTLDEVGLDSRADLERLVEEARGALGEIGDSLESLAKQERTGREQRDEARALADRFAELDGAATALAYLEAGREAHDARTSRLGQAEKAAGLDGAYEELTKRREELDEAQRALETGEQANKTAEQASRKAVAAFDREAGRAEQREAARRKVAKLEALIPVHVAWVAAEQRLGDLQAATDLASASRSDGEAAVARARDELAEREQELEALAAQAAQVDAIAARVDIAERLDEAAGRRDGARAGLKAAEADRDQAQAKLVELEDRRDRERGRLEGLLREQLDGQAAVLAAGLKTGQACPVCGSTEHPSPAEGSKEIPEPAAIEAQREKAAALDGELTEAREAVTGAAGRVAELNASLEGAERELGDRSKATVAELRQQVESARQALGDARRAAGRLSAAKDAFAERKRSLVNLERDVLRKREAEAKARQELASAEGVAREQRRRLHHSYRPEGALEAAVSKARQRAASLDEALEQARSNRDAAEKELTRWRENAAGRRKEARNKATILQQREQSFEQRLKKAGFRSEEAFAAARLEAAPREALSRQVDEYKSALESARNRVDRAATATAGRERPDLDATEAAHARARAALEGAHKRHAKLEERVSFLVGKLVGMDERAAEIDALDARFHLVGDLSEAANDKAMTFERWVLSALLDEVLAAASVRLKRMSRDRFLLRRDLDQRDRRRAGGLDLRVFDAHTGAERSATSLSGGEGFMAALSLALGLADVVQAHAGGIRLDTLFVDEGFGALDPEALDQAFQTLVDLRAEGRLVGVISHVPELAARIDARLEVRPAGRGSRANWSL